MTTLIGESEIRMAQMIAWKSALKLEVIGMKRRGRSVYSIVKEKFGLRGNKQSVYTQYCELVEAEKGKM